MRRRSESGYVLIGILVFMTLMMIAVAAIAPRIGTAIKRDRENELVRRGNQYVRAIQLYYRKFGRFPANVEQLENTNNIRFLRRRYIDPITGKDEWRLIRFGQAKPKQLPAWQKGKSGGGITSASAMSSTGTGVSGTGAAGSSPGSSASSSSSGSSSIGVNASDISKPLSGSSSIGSGGIVGVSSTSEKTGLKEIDGKKKYNEWEFVYDPTLDPLMRGAGMGQGAPIPNEKISNSPNPQSQPSPTGPTQRPQ